jgi:hypothetical protein
MLRETFKNTHEKILSGDQLRRYEVKLFTKYRRFW